MSTCNNINIVLQKICGNTSYLDGKIEIPNKNLENITR